ncbi:hypothetical protein ACP70R_000323 [Stipagrostis hirtigluma subsp. patula]
MAVLEGRRRRRRISRRDLEANFIPPLCERVGDSSFPFDGLLFPVTSVLVGDGGWFVWVVSVALRADSADLFSFTNSNEVTADAHSKPQMHLRGGLEVLALATSSRFEVPRRVGDRMVFLLRWSPIEFVGSDEDDKSSLKARVVYVIFSCFKVLSVKWWGCNVFLI